MSTVYPTLPKLVVRDNIDDDDLTDIDDEVFIRDGRNGGLKLDDDGGVKRPLMAPRRKCKKSCNFQTQKLPYKALFLPLCYGITALIIVLSLIILCIFTANIFPMPLTILKNWLSHELKNPVNKSEIIPCTSLSSEILWTKSLPKLTSEAPLRSNDVNSDGVEDIIVGFSTGLDTTDAPEYICTVYFGNQSPCLGGVLALDGKTGEVIWTHWTAHAVFSIDCGVDLTNDKIKDCVISGRGGILQAINARDGSNIWEVPMQDSTISNGEQQKISNDARFMRDIDGDGIGDVIASQAVQSDDMRTSKILIISGKSGNIIRSVNLPDSEQLFIAPQILVHPDGEDIFILATSSQQQAGGLYIASQASIFYGELQLRKLHHDTGKGALLPPILIDITSDGIEDIVAAMFNSTIMAYNGLTFEPIWNYTVPNTEVISIPIPGYYNDDDIPDFMVKHQIGAGFPTYYYSVATIVDGRNGQPLLEKPMEDSLSRQMSGLSITVDGFGNDWFLHWSADCLNYEGIKEKYQFLKGQSLVSQTRADLCRLRFNSTLIMKLFALSQHVGPPGIQLYYSEKWKLLEFNNSIDPRREAEKYLDAHPRSEIKDFYADTPFVSERFNARKNHRKSGIFEHKNNNLFSEIDSPNALYENVEEFKTHKKHNPMEDNVEENLNVDQTWKHNNKWVGSNIQSDKEYDGLYGGDEENNNEDGQSADYPQAEIREQRSIPAKQLNNKDIGIDKKRDKIEIDVKAVGVVTNTTDTMNVSMEITKEKILSTTSSSESNVEKIVAVQNTVDSGKIKSESFEVKNTSFEVPKVHTEASDIAKNRKISSNRYVIDTKEIEDVMKQRQFYKHNFPNIVQDGYDDASIERVFKRESLKNQNKDKNFKKRLPISMVKKDPGTVPKQRTKRNSETSQNSRSSEINGIQRQPPTGILLPSFTTSKGKSSVDLVFSTFWLPPSEVSLILSQTDLECIHRKKVQSENDFRYRKDEDIVSECLSERGVDYRLYQESMDRENMKIALGQMTVYRMKLECICPEDMLPNQTCKNISFRQSWPQHLGSSGNGYFKPLRK